MPYIQKALNDLKSVEPNSDRRQVLVKFLKTPMKLAAVIIRLGFLLSCRRAGIVPRFIANATSSVDKIFAGNVAIEKECKTFRTKLLNESIKDSFRNKAYLERCQKRDELELNQLDRRIFSWMKTACRRVFEDTLFTGRQKVARKFHELYALQSEGKTQVLGQNGRENGEKEHQQVDSTCKRVTNLSSTTVPESVMNVLKKGPKFALTSRIDDKTLLEVESGIERLAYGKRWKDFSSSKN